MCGHRHISLIAVGCDKLAGVLLPAQDYDGERRHTTMRLALVFQRLSPCSGVPAGSAITFRTGQFQAELVSTYRSAQLTHMMAQ